MGTVEELRVVASELARLEELRVERMRLVLLAREEGVSWREIAVALGVDRQTAMNLGTRAKRAL